MSANNKKQSKKMTEEDKKDWGDLYQYVKKEILLYDDNQSLSKEMVLRLRGLMKGKLFANKATQDYAEYNYKTILYTFKICRPNILRSITGKDFNNEVSKFLYICAIVENNINDVYTRLKRAEESKASTESMDMENITHEGAEYKSDLADIPDRLKKLW